MCACSGTELCLTLCDPMDCCPPGASGHGILQAFAWSGLPFLPPGDLPDPGIKPHLVCLLHWQVDSLPLSHLGSPEIAVVCCKMRYFSQAGCYLMGRAQAGEGPLNDGGRDHSSMLGMCQHFLLLVPLTALLNLIIQFLIFSWYCLIYISELLHIK